MVYKNAPLSRLTGLMMVVKIEPDFVIWRLSILG